MRRRLGDDFDPLLARRRGRLRADADGREGDAEPSEGPRRGGRREHDEVAGGRLGGRELPGPVEGHERRAKLVDEQLKVIDTFGLEAIKTSELAGVLRALAADGRVLVVAPGRDQNLELSARNLPTVEVILADSLNVVDLIKADLVLIEQPSLARMQEVYA